MMMNENSIRQSTVQGENSQVSIISVLTALTAPSPS